MKNKFKTASVFLFYFSILLIIIMVIYSLIDYKSYLQHPEYSAPFSLNLIFTSIVFGLPIITGFILSAIYKKKALK